MPIQFRCPECQRRLAAPRRKAGAALHCPSCQALIAVPEEEPASDGTEATAGSGSFRDVDLIAFPTDRHADPQQDGDWLAVSRLTIFLQGVLLAATAVVFFVAGMVIGRSTAPTSGRSEVRGPAEVEGQVWYESQGRRRVDAGAVVMLLPADFQPDSKLSPEGLRPKDAPVSTLHPSVEAIHRWGGDVIRADTAGRFRLRVPRGGSFFFLVMSAHVARGDERPALKDLAQIGRFFLPAVDLLADQAYRWQRLELSGKRRLGDVVIRPPQS